MGADRNLLVRVASAAVGLPLLGYIVLWPPPIVFGIFSLVIAGLGLCEYAALTLRERSRVERVVVVVIGTGFAAGVYVRPDLAAVWGMAATILVAAVALVMTRSEDVPTSGARLGIMGF